MVKAKVMRDVKDSPSAMAFSSSEKRSLLHSLAKAQKNIKAKFKKAYTTRKKRERQLEKLFKPVTSKFTVTTVEKKGKKSKKNKKNDDSSSSDNDDDIPPRPSPASARARANRSFYDIPGEPFRASGPQPFPPPPRGPSPSIPRMHFPMRTSAGPRLENNIVELPRTPPRLSTPIKDYVSGLNTPRMTVGDFFSGFPTPNLPGTAPSGRIPISVRRLHTDANFGDSPDEIGPVRKTKKKGPNREKYGKSLESNFIPYNASDRVIYEYFDDPNELCDRLRLLTSSRSAGNTNHMQEINSIIEELRELGYVQ